MSALSLGATILSDQLWSSLFVINSNALPLVLIVPTILTFWVKAFNLVEARPICRENQNGI